MFLKPKDMKRLPRPAFKTMHDGREICLDTDAGRAEYARRRIDVWHRDKGICGWCVLGVPLLQATADHIVPRGMHGAFRDDRRPNLRPAHFYCNSERSSSRLLTRAEWLASKREGRAA